MNPPLTPGQLNGRVFKTSGQILCGVKGTNHFRIFYKFIQIKKKKELMVRQDTQNRQK